MQVVNLPLSGLKLLKPASFADERGFFCELYRRPLYQESGIDCDFVQDNHAFSKKGTLRGMHFQRRPGQAKLVTVLSGEIFDVAVDLRPDSPTFGKWFGLTLKAETHEQFFVPVGFAHGYCVLSETAHVLYKVSSLYDPVEESGFHYADAEVGIAWPVAEPVVSSRDQKAVSFREVLV